ncbi:MAG TPA: glycine cleavage system protein GcvH [Burkholderiales bacterium]|nr:glycine cleavage system protein GcvH [Burkholderiales bacterium]
MQLPDNLKYTETHEWVRREADGTVTVGITDHAQQQLGDVVFVDMPAAGRSFKKGEECGVIESVKAAADIYAPVSGEIIASNAALADAPEKLNQAPYETWLFKIKPQDAGEVQNLLDAAGYQKVADADQH